MAFWETASKCRCTLDASWKMSRIWTHGKEWSKWNNTRPGCLKRRKNASNSKTGEERPREGKLTTNRSPAKFIQTQPLYFQPKFSVQDQCQIYANSKEKSLKWQIFKSEDSFMLPDLCLWDTILEHSEKKENVQSIIHHFLFVLGEMPKKHPETFPHFLLPYIHVSGNE